MIPLSISTLPENQQDESRRNNHGANGENNGEYPLAVRFTDIRGVHLAGFIGGFVHGLLRRGSGAFRLRFRRSETALEGSEGWEDSAGAEDGAELSAGREDSTGFDEAEDAGVLGWEDSGGVDGAEGSDTG